MVVRQQWWTAPERHTRFYTVALLLLIGVTVLLIATLVTDRLNRRQSRGLEQSATPWQTDTDTTTRELKTKAQPLHTIWTDPHPPSPARLDPGGVAARRIRRRRWADPTRGVVLCAGGRQHGTNATMLVLQLRYHGCTLPIEWFYDGADEITPSIIDFLATQNVVCHDLRQVLPWTLRQRFARKVAALYCSVFDEVLYLDADNNVLRDPTFLFDEPLYRATGALWWPDYWVLDRTAPCWAQLPVGRHMPSNRLYAMESGQMVVARRRYWRELWCVLCIVDNDLVHLFPQPCNEGDKDVFHVTWAARGQKDAMVPWRATTIGPRVDLRTSTIVGQAMGQHDPAGELLFVHQNMQDWCNRSTSWAGPVWKYAKRFVDRQGTRGTHQHGSWNPIDAPTEVIELDRQLEHVYYELWQREIRTNPVFTPWR